jgi:hypothetical protein
MLGSETAARLSETIHVFSQLLDAEPSALLPLPGHVSGVRREALQQFINGQYQFIPICST